MSATVTRTTNARDAAALAYLQVGLDDAVLTGRPTVVRSIPTSLTNAELVRLAVALCKECTERTFVLGGDSVTFVPIR